ncbi:MAG: UDP-3-O-acyl-N-acetylglucosamine deacetylase, partial [Merismopedia sp. SIO2A8]|nr:UDP-3-O-acyl-N-acetylglucosamine deacetylase [Merismopedia sp. SIO2A8]
MDASTLVLANDSSDRPLEGSPSLSHYQHTLATSFTKQGVGLHSGKTVRVTVRPTTEAVGRQFVRIDCPSAATIPAHISAVEDTQLSTQLGNGKVSVRTVEHLLAALVAAGIDNAYIDIDGPEVPLLDGSAKEWVEAIAQAGIQPQTIKRPIVTLKNPVSLYRGDAFVMAFPATIPRLTYGIDFPAAVIGNQWHSWSPAVETFNDTIAPARTFTMAHQVDYLRQQGLIKGGSLDNALVCDLQKGWLNPPLRFPNEPVRHKLLDLVGDLSLLGHLPSAQ